jgi:5'-3' exonuclease
MRFPKNDPRLDAQLDENAPLYTLMRNCIVHECAKSNTTNRQKDIESEIHQRISQFLS